MSPRRRLGYLVAAALACTLPAVGCSVGRVAMYLIHGEPTLEPAMKRLASDDDEKEVKVVLVTFPVYDTRPEFLRVDRDLANFLAATLQASFEKNKEKVTVVPTRKVESFKNDHPGWQNLDLEEIGRHFEADYVIGVEFDAISLYEKGSMGQLYRGRAQLTVSLVDVNHPDQSPARQTVSRVYPSDARGPISVSEASPDLFKQAFVAHLAKRVSWLFTSHPRDDEYKE